MHSSCRHAVRQTKHRVHILQTALLDQEAGSLRSTVSKIEKDTKATARRTWKKMYGGIEPYGVVVAKIDVYDILMGEPQETLNEVCLSLATGITVSTTSSTSLGARSQGSGAMPMQSQQVPRARRTLQRHGGRHPDHPGQHPYCGETRMHVGTQLADGYTTLTKLHNEIVSQFEAGEVQAKFGGKLCEYVDCSICKTFLHPDVQEQGCTRIEVSLYACRGSKLSSMIEVVYCCPFCIASLIVNCCLSCVSSSNLSGCFLCRCFLKIGVL